MKNRLKYFVVVLLFLTSLSFNKVFSDVPITWNFPVQVLTPTGVLLNVQNPQLASDSTGTIIHAIWNRDDTVSDIIETASSYDGGITWSVNTLLTTSGPGLDARNAQIATDSSGTIVHAVWSRGTAFGNVIQTMSSLDGGRTWPPAGTATILTVSVAINMNSSIPHITTNDAGTIVHIIWTRSEAPGPDNFWAETSSSYDSGATWPAAGSATPLDSSSGFGKGIGTPQIVCDSTGNKVHAIWKKVILGPVGRIYTRTSLNAGGLWASSQGLSHALQTSVQPQIATDVTGTNVHAIWYTQNGTNQVVYTNSSLNSGTTWGVAPGTQLSITGANRDATEPQITTNSTGTIVHGIWRRETGISDIIETMTSYDSGATWPAQGTATQLSQIGNLGEHSFTPQIATESSGNNVVAIWARNNGTNQAVEATNSIDAGRTWPPLGSEIILSSVVAGESAGNPQVIMNEPGSRVHAIWAKNNGTNTQVETLGGVFSLWPLTHTIDIVR